MEDDWEPYMRAALQRENESVIDDEEDTQSFGSVESLQTYPLV